jgi:hypothetical protein
LSNIKGVDLRMWSPGAPFFLQIFCETLCCWTEQQEL